MIAEIEGWNLFLIVQECVVHELLRQPKLGFLTDKQVQEIGRRIGDRVLDLMPKTAADLSDPIYSRDFDRPPGSPPGSPTGRKPARPRAKRPGQKALRAGRALVKP